MPPPFGPKSAFLLVKLWAKVAFFDVLGKMMKKSRVLKSQNHCISTIDLDFCFNFMGFKFLEFFSGFHVGFLVFMASNETKQDQK